MSREPASKRFSLFEVKEDENFNRRNILNLDPSLPPSFIKLI